MKSAEYFIDNLKLQKHPEGGWYREVYRSDDLTGFKDLQIGSVVERSFSTSIYYMLTGNDFSAFHRIKSDEIWHHYYSTSAVEILIPERDYVKRIILGADLAKGHHFQYVVPKNKWFAAHLLNTEGFALVGCTVSPGFHFEDFELADERLINEFPALEAEISPYIL